MIEVSFSVISGYVFIAWLTGYAAGRVHAFFKVMLDRSTGTF